MPTMTVAEANAVYDVLVRECGADDRRYRLAHPRGAFVGAMTTTRRPATEWRFQCMLGYGVKFYIGDAGEPHRVHCYREDETPELLAMVERANAAFMEMVKVTRG